MKTVLLLGAGATLAHAQALGTESKYLPPLDANVFERARSLDHEYLDDVVAFVESYFGLPIGKSRVSAEHVFNLIYQYASDDPSDSRDAEPIFAKLRRLYSDMIAECTNKLHGKAEAGLTGLFRRMLEDVKREHLCIVSFNYDLIAEKTLASLSITSDRQDQVFSTWASYSPMKFDQVFPAGGSEQFCPFELPEIVQILKPHGSLNWFLAYKDADGFLGVNPLKPAEVWCCADKTIRTDYENLDYFGPGSVSWEPTYFMRPLMVPPVFDKAKYWGALLNPVWTGFRKALSEADRLVVCGYSLPDADVKAQTVITGALASNHHLKQIDIIDVNPDVCSRFVQKTCINSVTYYDSIRSFLEQQP